MYFECCSNIPIIGHKELGTVMKSAVLKDPSSSTNEDAVDLLSYISGIAISSSAARPRLWNQEPSILSHQDLASFERNQLFTFL